MFDEKYREQMNALKFDPDFEKRTIQKIEQSLAFAAPKRKHRRQRGWIMGAGLGVAAAALVAVFALSGPFTPPVKQDTVLLQARPTPAPAAQTGKSVPSATSMPMPDAATSRANVQTDSLGAGAVPESAQFTDEAAMDLYDGAYESADLFTYVPYTRQAPNTSEYSHIAETGFIDTVHEPLSTFAADVDTASYANARAMLTAGQLPQPDQVRVEEFLNYFRYDYPAPKAGEPFSVTTEIAPCPWNDKSRLFMVGLQAENIDASKLPASNLVFLIDVSGSMDESNKLPLAQSAFRMVIESLRHEDTVSIVTYAGSDRVVLDGARGDEKEKIAGAIDSLFAYGSTDGASGIETAYRLAEKHFITGGNNRVVLATDGDLNVGVTSEGELTRLIEEKKLGGVFLSVMGFGEGNYKDNKLEALADHGNGNYSYIDSLLEAKKVLVEELGATFFTVCKDVKLQVEFNPAKVAAYRLIGYENRALAARDFADDKKDGGEIGAGHSVTALYELTLAGDGGGTQPSLKYQTASLTDSREYLTVSIRAKAPDADESQLYTYPVDESHVTDQPSSNLRFASAVAEVAMLLRNSEYAGSASYEAASQLLEGIDALTKDPYKDEFAYITRQLARTQGA